MEQINGKLRAKIYGNNSAGKFADKFQTNRKEKNGKMEAPPSLFQNKYIRVNWVVGEI